MTPIQTQITDERTITVPIPADGTETAKVADFCRLASADDYDLTGAATIQGGDQRDPYTTGLRLVFTRQS